MKRKGLCLYYSISEAFLAILHSTIIGMASDKYPSLEALLDDLYTHYLEKQYTPFTYGQEWILTSNNTSVRRLLVPWSWFLEKDPHQSLSRSNPQWQTSPPAAYGLVRKTKWGIIDRFPLSVFGVATNNPKLGKFLLFRSAFDEITGGKAAGYFDQTIAYEYGKNADKYIRSINQESITINEYEFSCFYATKYKQLEGKVLIPGTSSIFYIKA